MSSEPEKRMKIIQPNELNKKCIFFWIFVCKKSNLVDVQTFFHISLIRKSCLWNTMECYRYILCFWSYQNAKLNWTERGCAVCVLYQKPKNKKLSSRQHNTTGWSGIPKRVLANSESRRWNVRSWVRNFVIHVSSKTTVCHRKFYIYVIHWMFTSRFIFCDRNKNCLSSLLYYNRNDWKRSNIMTTNIETNLFQDSKSFGIQFAYFWCSK